MVKYKIVHICYSDKNKIPEYVYKKLKKQNPDYDINLYGDKECYDFLLKYFSKDYAIFFNNISDGPIKADFWRLCILYIFGGVYLDIDVELYKPLDFIIPDDINFLTSTSRQKKCLNPIIIYSEPKNILLYNTILSMYEKRKKKYSYWGYSVCRTMKVELEKLYFSEYNDNINNIISSDYNIINNKLCIIKYNYFTQGEIILNNKKYRFLYETKDGSKTYYNNILLMNNHRPYYNNHKFITKKKFGILLIGKLIFNNDDFDILSNKLKDHDIYISTYIEYKNIAYKLNPKFCHFIDNDIYVDKNNNSYNIIDYIKNFRKNKSGLYQWYHLQKIISLNYKLLKNYKILLKLRTFSNKIKYNYFEINDIKNLEDNVVYLNTDLIFYSKTELFIKIFPNFEYNKK